jgi:quercetin dioxygenase-like cupin family protein
MGSGNRRRVTHLPPSEGRAVWTAGGTYTFKAVGEDTEGAFVLLEGTVSPQAGPPPHVHTREDEFIYVLEGELEVLDGERAFTASAGSYVYIPRHTLHRFKNVQEATTRILIGFTPAGFEGFFFATGEPAREGEVAPPFGEEELQRALREAPKYGLEVPPPPEQ